MLDDPERREAIARRGLEVVHEHLDSAASAGALADVLEGRATPIGDPPDLVIA